MTTYITTLSLLAIATYMWRKAYLEHMELKRIRKRMAKLNEIEDKLVECEKIMDLINGEDDLDMKAAWLEVLNKELKKLDKIEEEYETIKGD